MAFKKPLIYCPNKNEPIRILKWFRWPSYDFLFGVPCAENPWKNEEVGFFQYRDTRRRKIIEGFYMDLTELSDLIEGFQAIRVEAVRRFS